MIMEPMNFMRVSLMRNFSTCKDEMKQIKNEQKLLGEEHISAIRSTELFLHRSSSILQHRSTSTIQHRSTAVHNQKPLHPSDIQRGRQPLHVTTHYYRTPAEEKDEYGIYRVDQGYARDVDGHTIRVHNKDIRRLLERASRDEHIYICLPEHASSFTQTKIVPEIYTKEEINEMFYGICGEHEKNKEDFQMKLDGVYYPLNDSISWLNTCMEEMRQDIARIQRANNVSRSTSIDRHRQASIDSRLKESIDNRLSASVDDNPPHSHTMKSQPDFHTRGEIHQLVEGIYRALETTEERLDR
ncbi:hypothetical protein F2Q68_00034656 [Brassica cretica]|uniref:Uncharacterized protein n=1 Tax=Brassica cretica TaxID=69181 RepID=A0A8S9HDA0_BRACR|nr:hypothetical protein F2Q68_00034656 [Brassica cretica]